VVTDPDAVGGGLTDLVIPGPRHRLAMGQDGAAAAPVVLAGRGGAAGRAAGPGPAPPCRHDGTVAAPALLPGRGRGPASDGPDVLRAPTRSDEELSLPALLVADIPMQPDRRRLLPGAHLARLADGYADFARALPPAARLVLVPAPGFARSEADGVLREALVRE